MSRLFAILEKIKAKPASLSKNPVIAFFPCLLGGTVDFADSRSLSEQEGLRSQPGFNAILIRLNWSVIRFWL
ncbi:hypothetical protein [Nostoc sp. ATCC 53789]|uniref:hypothetical protein n=1 Tax=Nostoc sp. ATCC 53789 TaxID=76335 RepID=UPI000DEC8071|nr:hypothetical protein [Nostoc sp. ATCC 53789]QHG21219.1 hypothetical protein GJB62_35810 [Nostoc sp. ATCC 53789]RCJ16898.1 hypothetical protein A6V25_29890 [Nostoc sp. ATCC 53789]